MISIKFFNIISKALPRTRCMVSGGELILIDRNAEVIGQLNFQGRGVTVFKDYSHWRKVLRRLQGLNIPVEVRNLDMEEATKIIYNN